MIDVTDFNSINGHNICLGRGIMGYVFIDDQVSSPVAEARRHQHGARIKEVVALRHYDITKGR